MAEVAFAIIMRVWMCNTSCSCEGVRHYSGAAPHAAVRNLSGAAPHAAVRDDNGAAPHAAVTHCSGAALQQLVPTRGLGRASATDCTGQSHRDVCGIQHDFNVAVNAHLIDFLSCASINGGGIHIALASAHASGNAVRASGQLQRCLRVCNHGQHDLALLRKCLSCGGHLQHVRGGYNDARSIAALLDEELLQWERPADWGTPQLRLLPLSSQLNLTQVGTQHTTAESLCRADGRSLPLHTHLGTGSVTRWCKTCLGAG